MNRMLATTISLSALSLTLMSAVSVEAQTLTQPIISATALISTVGFQGADAAYNEGVTLFEKGDIAGATAKFEAAIKARPSFTQAHLNLGICYALANKLDGAVTEFTWVIDKKMPPAPKGFRADAYLERGRAYISQKKVKEAIADFNASLEIKPENVEVLPNRAAAFFSDGQLEKAIADYDTYLKTAQKPDPSVFSNYGLVYLSKYQASKADADAKAAITYFDKYITADPKATDGYLFRGDANIATKAFDKAVVDYTKYLAANAKDDAALSSRARAYMELKKYKEAADDYKAALAIKPTPEGKINLGIAQLQGGDKQGAIATLATAVGTPPTAKDKPALTARAQAYIDIKDYPNAIKDYTALLTIDPKESTALYNRGVAYVNSDANDKAAEDFTKYIADPNAKDKHLALTGLGAANMKLKKFPEAAKAFEQYVAAKPDDATGFYNLGAAYYNVGVTTKAPADYEKAAANLEKYLAMKPTDKDLMAAANKLLPDALLGAGKDPAAIIVALDKAILADPKNADLLINRGVLYLNQKPMPNYDKAIADFTAAAAVNTKDPVILYNRAVAHVGKKDWMNVIKDTTAALALKPDYSDALVARADANFSAKTYPAAIADYKAYAAMAKEPKDKAYAFSQAANAALAVKDYAGATDALTQYLTVATPEDQAAGLLRRGIAYLASEKNDEGIKDLTDYLAKPAPAPDKVKPEEYATQKSSALFNRGAAYAKKMDFAKAATDFEEAFKVKADFSAATQAALMYTKQGDAVRDAEPMKAAPLYTKAIENYDKAIGMGKGPNPKDLADAYFNKGVVLESKYKADEQVDNLKAAVEAYTKYIEEGKKLTPPAADIADVQKQIEALKAQIAELG